MSNAYSNWIFKSSKNLKSFDVSGFFIQNVKCILQLDNQIIQELEIFRRYGFFHSKYQMHTPIGYPNHQRTWNLSTLVVFFIQNVKCILQLDIQIIKELEIFRRYGFFHSKCQMHTPIGYPNHQRTWNLSSLRFF